LDFARIAIISRWFFGGKAWRQIRGSGFPQCLHLALFDQSRPQVIYVDIAPDAADAYFNRGLNYKAQGEKAEALTDFQKLITLTDNPEWVAMAKEEIEELSK